MKIGHHREILPLLVSFSGCMWAWNSSPFLQDTFYVWRNISSLAGSTNINKPWFTTPVGATNFFGCHACWSLAKIRCTWPHNSWRNWTTSILFRCWIVTSGWWNLMVPILEFLNSTFPLRDSPLDQLSFSLIRGGHWALSKLCCLAGWLVPHHVA